MKNQRAKSHLNCKFPGTAPFKRSLRFYGAFHCCRLATPASDFVGKYYMLRYWMYQLLP